MAEIEIQLLQFMIFSNNFSHEARHILKSYLLNTEQAKPECLESESSDIINDIENNLKLRTLEEAEFNNQSLTCFLSFNERSSIILENKMDFDSPVYIHLQHERIVIRKILSYMLLLNKYICMKMKINIKYCIVIEKLIKELILCSKNIDFFNDKHLDQVVLCCIITVLYNEKIISSEEIISKVTHR